MDYDTWLGQGVRWGRRERGKARRERDIGFSYPWIFLRQMFGRAAMSPSGPVSAEDAKLDSGSTRLGLVMLISGIAEI
jgi:hypothetical protein